MEKLLIHLEGMPRLHPGCLPLAYAGYLSRDNAPDKTVVHPTLNFCLVLSSDSESLTYEVNNVSQTSKTPLLAVHIPGMSWRRLTSCRCEVLYFSYNKSLLSRFESFIPGPSLRPLRVTSFLTDQIGRVLGLMCDMHDRGNVDRLDRLAEAVIVEALLSTGSRSEMSAPEMAVRKIASRIEISYDKEIDLGALLEEHGLSMRTFTRYWGRLQPLPFNKHVNKLRMEEAKRLLESCELRINEIAKRVGFHDPYYFTRQFTRYAGVGPRRYAESLCSPAR